jgi:hypothetical protein
MLAQFDWVTAAAGAGAAATGAVAAFVLPQKR